MKTTTIRIPESLFGFIESAAREDGVSNAAWIRDACLVRSAFRYGYRTALDDFDVPEGLRAEVAAWLRSRPEGGR